MRQLSKDQWRKIHGIREPKDSADPEVISRLPLHKRMIDWEIVWSPRLHATSTAIGLVFILLPTINEGWHELISHTPAVLRYQQEFSHFKATPIILLAIGVLLHLYSSSKIDGKSFSEYGYPINLSHIRSAKNIIKGDLFPRTRTEERIFFADFAGGLWIATAFWHVLFGGISWLINLK